MSERHVLFRGTARGRCARRCETRSPGSVGTEKRELTRTMFSRPRFMKQGRGRRVRVRDAVGIYRLRLDSHFIAHSIPDDGSPQCPRNFSYELYGVDAGIADVLRILNTHGIPTMTSMSGLLRDYPDTKEGAQFGYILFFKLPPKTEARIIRAAQSCGMGAEPTKKGGWARGVRVDTELLKGGVNARELWLRARLEAIIVRMPTKVDDVLDLEQLAKLLGVPGPDKWHDSYSGTYGYAYDDAIAHGYTEEESEEIAQKAEEEERDELYGKYHTALIATADHIFGEHLLILVPGGKQRVVKRGQTYVDAPTRGKYPWQYRVVPEQSWNDAAYEIMKTINGVGSFEFSSLREFIDSGPYTSARQAVLQHLHWMKRYPDVYGEMSTERYFENELR